MPPATAPNGTQRPVVEIRPDQARLNSDLEATVSSALMHDNDSQDAKTRKMAGSQSNALKAEAKLEAEKQANQLSQNWRVKRKTMPLTSSIDKKGGQTLDKPSQGNSSQVGSGRHRHDIPKSVPALSNQISNPSHQKGGGQVTSSGGNLVSPIVSEDLTSAQAAIRKKLAEMKQLFDDEDEQEKDDLQNRAKKSGIPRPESSEWDLHKHKI